MKYKFLFFIVMLIACIQSYAFEYKDRQVITIDSIIKPHTAQWVATMIDSAKQLNLGVISSPGKPLIALAMTLTDCKSVEIVFFEKEGGQLHVQTDEGGFYVITYMVSHKIFAVFENTRTKKLASDPLDEHEFYCFYWE